MSAPLTPDATSENRAAGERERTYRAVRAPLTMEATVVELTVAKSGEEDDCSTGRERGAECGGCVEAPRDERAVSSSSNNRNGSVERRWPNRRMAVRGAIQRRSHGISAMQLQSDSKSSPSDGMECASSGCGAPLLCRLCPAAARDETGVLACSVVWRASRRAAVSAQSRQWHGQAWAVR